MSDDIDRAQARQAEFNADALRDHWARQPIGIGLEHCEICHEEIPLRRRQAVPTCTKCVSCQEHAEIHHHWRAL